MYLSSKIINGIKIILFACALMITKYVKKGFLKARKMDPLQSSNGEFHTNMLCEHIELNDTLNSSLNGFSEISPTLPDIIHILQGFGFYTRFWDACPPEDTTALKYGKKGLRIIAVCNYSGHRYFLERPISANACRCEEDSRENQGTPCETEGNNSITPLSKELQKIICVTMNDLLHVLHGCNTVANKDPLEISSVSELAAGISNSYSTPNSQNISLSTTSSSLSDDKFSSGKSYSAVLSGDNFSSTSSDKHLSTQDNDEDIYCAVSPEQRKTSLTLLKSAVNNIMSVISIMEASTSNEIIANNI